MRDGRREGGRGRGLGCRLGIYRTPTRVTAMAEAARRPFRRGGCRSLFFFVSFCSCAQACVFFLLLSLCTCTFQVVTPPSSAANCGPGTLSRIPKLEVREPTVIFLVPPLPSLDYIALSWFSLPHNDDLPPSPDPLPPFLLSPSSPISHPLDRPLSLPPVQTLSFPVIPAPFPPPHPPPAQSPCLL